MTASFRRGTYLSGKMVRFDDSRLGLALRADHRVHGRQLLAAALGRAQPRRLVRFVDSWSPVGSGVKHGCLDRQVAIAFFSHCCDRFLGFGVEKRTLLDRQVLCFSMHSAHYPSNYATLRTRVGIPLILLCTLRKLCVLF